MERACIFLSRTLPLRQRAYTIYCFWILDAKVAPPPHATWYVRRVCLPPALKALTCRLGAPAHPWNERAFSYPGRCRSGNAIHQSPHSPLKIGSFKLTFFITKSRFGLSKLQILPGAAQPWWAAPALATLGGRYLYDSPDSGSTQSGQN